jgi:hypothetical protein
MNQSIFWQEKATLVRALQNGRPIPAAYKFFDCRNRALAGLLNHFLKIFPQEQFSDSWFLYFCNENGFFESSGEKAYFESIFSGVGATYE